jgi:hypothetical protein
MVSIQWGRDVLTLGRYIAPRTLRFYGLTLGKFGFGLLVWSQGEPRTEAFDRALLLFTKVAALRDAIPPTEVTALAVIGEVLSIIEKEDQS